MDTIITISHLTEDTWENIWFFYAPLRNREKPVNTSLRNVAWSLIVLDYAFAGIDGYYDILQKRQLRYRNYSCLKYLKKMKKQKKAIYGASPGFPVDIPTIPWIPKKPKNPR